MFIKYSPTQQNGMDSVIEVLDENTLRINGEEYEFDPSHTIWEGSDLTAQTNGVITEAHRNENGVLFVTVQRIYSKDCGWDTGDYHEVSGQDI